MNFKRALSRITAFALSALVSANGLFTSDKWISNAAETIASTEITLNTAALESMSLGADELVDSITFGWNLGNTMDSLGPVAVETPEYYETWWSNPRTEQHMFDTLKETGINAVRIPITWFPHLDEDNQIAPDWMNRIKEIVDMAIASDMYCIINMHHDTGENTGKWLVASSDNYNANKDKFAAIWKQIAEEFIDYDERLLFEGFNEMLNASNNWGGFTADALSAIDHYNQLFVDTVRATGGNNADRCLVCTTYAAAAYGDAINKFSLPEDTAQNRLIAEVHAYVPWEFCASDNTDVTTFQDSDVTSVINNLKTTFVDNGIPTIIGEFACYDKGNYDERIRWADLYTATAESCGIKCFWWDDGNLLSRCFDTWLYPELVETIMANVGVEYTMPEFPAYGLEDGNLTPYLYNYKTYYNGGLASLSCDKTGNSITMQVLNGGSKPGDVQAYYNNVALEENTTYTVSFQASCEGIAELPVRLLVEQVYPAFVDYFISPDVTLNTQTQKFEFVFEIGEITQDYNFNFIFYLGCDTNAAPYTVNISNLTVVEYQPEALQKGDINADGTVTMADIALLQKWLLSVPDTVLPDWEAGDMDGNKQLDASDLVLLKRIILQNTGNSTILAETENRIHDS